jgi:hypothetical protein
LGKRRQKGREEEVEEKGYGCLFVGKSLTIFILNEARILGLH